MVPIIDKTEKLIGRKIRYGVFGTEGFEGYRKKLPESEGLLLWKS